MGKVTGENLVAAWQVKQDKFAITSAHKELIEITGITKARDTVAQVKYIWKEVPTEAGRAFNSGSPEYQSLPASLQQTLSGRKKTYQICR